MEERPHLPLVMGSLSHFQTIARRSQRLPGAHHKATEASTLAAFLLPTTHPFHLFSRLSWWIRSGWTSRSSVKRHARRSLCCFCRVWLLAAVNCIAFCLRSLAYHHTRERLPLCAIKLERKQDAMRFRSKRQQRPRGDPSTPLYAAAASLPRPRQPWKAELRFTAEERTSAM